jgi:hypothetical protein
VPINENRKLCTKTVDCVFLGYAHHSIHYRKQGKIPRLQLRNLFTKSMTIRYIRWLTKKYLDEYKGDGYNLIHSSVTWNRRI